MLSAFRPEGGAGETAGAGGQRPHALGPRILGRQADPDRHVPVGAQEHRREGGGRVGRLRHPHRAVRRPQLAARLG